MEQYDGNKNTNDLHQALMSAPDLDGFLADNEQSFHNEDVRELLNRMFARRELSKSALAKRSGMSEVYLHQIFSGRRRPSRGRLLCLAIGLSATLEETQELLRRCGQAELYPRDRRDAIIIFGILHGMDLFEINDKLFSEDEETLL